MKKEFIKVTGLTKYFGENKVPTIENINLTINQGEFIAILGPSGSGKSTILRAITGLIEPSEGEIIFDGEKVTGVNPYASIVFQTFALYPWLTVLENVELGLKAKGFPKEYTRRKAEELIDLIGLDGFEEAYPKELSGGMRQRVGFARALAVEPKLLCMDEPFSALDFLTAENLRTELIDLWTDKRMPIKSIIMITHAIEDAVLMADRIVILSKQPAGIVTEIKVELPHPRNRKSPEFENIVDNIYRVITKGQFNELEKGKTEIPPNDGNENIDKPVLIPKAPIGVLSGLLEMIDDNNGEMDIYQLGRDLMMEINDLLPNIEGLGLLDFIKIKEGDIFITDVGLKFVEADIDESKTIFKEQLEEISTFRLIMNVLGNKKNHTMKEEFFKEIFIGHFPEEQIDVIMDSIIDWGRYAELFSYDGDSEELYIED
ncbi:nitrate/sulfonate/bicarbonate ABC transporter ATP-binding protein [Clostridium tagluense]|uniref:ABC transporter ATP-binding protein n=1 Tax=Clostridium TaxID=1485 RepID=UPI001651E0BE|nr:MULTISPECIES: nitrate/sulfonate/bicarbonate ABC transporter ATP-binding protein [Clostridium]MBW9156868.1 nitrate/sulfonate/bicarbonate ABC transporter ATP-binding protein [Clostridium tagluense]MBZ9622031.1 nitrate/sulfonate/bicarbonate ABC transporter ATP-binding protein [Clostridium sp. FP2]MCB2311471.1 nitrate/sulfonate/bicarbonate ABC transporter ATP-binding protein [Clostridium tagluense]MCB2316195.1 nitrate/sulfonate/bicarbonate ABC transporter ATP-binding protein [Clostridium tagluen